MTIVEPGKGRAIIELSGAELRITVPAAIHLFTTAFMSLWMIGWAFGEVSVIYHMFFSPIAQRPPGFAYVFLLAWLAMWTLGGAWCLGTLLWNVAGKEIIELNSTTLKRRKQIPVFSRSREYAVASIANLRLAPSPPSPLWYNQQNMSFLAFNEGTISFDYGRDTHHLASGLDEADAKYLIGEMCKRVKSLCR